VLAIFSTTWAARGSRPPGAERPLAIAAAAAAAASLVLLAARGVLASRRVWVAERVRVERCREAKFRFLLDPSLWSRRGDESSERVGQFRQDAATIASAGPEAAAAWGESDAIPTARTIPVGSGIDPHTVHTLMDYYQARRIDPQLARLGREGEGVRGGNPFPPPAGVLAACVSFVLAGAVLALLPSTRAGVLVSLAPWAAEGLDWFAGMADSNVREYTTAANGPEELTAHLVRVAADIRANPVSHVSTLSPEMPEVDRRIVADAGIRALLAENYAEALRESADGWIDDALAFCAPWGFDLADIRVPVLLWHGQNDVFSPVAHTRWLADQIPGANLSIRPNAAHFAAIVVMPDVLSWLIKAALGRLGLKVAVLQPPVPEREDVRVLDAEHLPQAPDHPVAERLRFFAAALRPQHDG